MTAVRQLLLARESLVLPLAAMEPEDCDQMEAREPAWSAALRIPSISF